MGSTPSLDGVLDLGTLYVTALTLGAIQVTVTPDGTPIVDTAGTVESVDGDYVVTVEGITLTLTGSDELSQAVGKSAQIDGELTGTYVTVASLIF